MSSGRPDLREKWYHQGWYSDRTCVDAFRDGWSRYGDVPLTFVAAGAEKTVTVGEIGALARTVATGLRQIGVQRGDAVAVQLTNRLECAVAYQAVMLCGAVLVPIVHIYGAAEVEFILAQSAAATLIMPHTFRSTRYVDRVSGYRDIPTLRDVVVLDAEPAAGYIQVGRVGGLVGGVRSRPTRCGRRVRDALYLGHHLSAERCSTQSQFDPRRAEDPAGPARRGIRTLSSW